MSRAFRSSALLLSSFVFLAGCAKTTLFDLNDGEGVAPDSAEITAESYKSRKVKIQVPPGNTRLTWATLYSDFPKTLKDEYKAFENDPVGLKAAIDKKYEKALKSITKNRKTLEMIRDASLAHSVDPGTTLCTVIGEHSLNVGLADDVQTYGVVSTKWAARWALQFSTGLVGTGYTLVDVVKMPEFDVCRDSKRVRDQAEYWECVAHIWNSKIQGQTIRDEAYPKGGFRTIFFNPIGSGYTYGLGQLDPYRALMVADRVTALGKLPMISINDAAGVYEAIINPRTGVHYIAANIRLALERYNDIANFDISQNPGLSATLYNKGAERAAAHERYSENVASLSKGGKLVLPRENFYGFVVNEKAPELQKLMREFK